MAKSEFAFATVKSVKPLTIQLDGDSTVIPAVTYAVTVKVKQRVEVRVRKPPQPPLITRVLTSTTNFVTNGGQFVAVQATADLPDSDDPTTISGWSILEGSAGFAVAGSHVTVDADLYPDGTVFAVYSFTSGSVTMTDVTSGLAVTDVPSLIGIDGEIGGTGVHYTLNSFLKRDGTPDMRTCVSTYLGTVAGGAISIALTAVAAQCADVIATVTGAIITQILIYPLLTSAGSS